MRAAEALVRIGEPGTETILIKALNKYNDKSMAEDFLNCGNNQLEEAAKKWARVHGYMEWPDFGSDSPTWGN